MADLKNYPNSQKGSKQQVENYRPVAGLCSASKTTNRLSVLNGKIPLDWLNSTIDTFKVKCKNLML